MLTLVSNIVITQQPNITYPNRNKVYTLNFLHDCEIVSSWKNLTTTAKLKLPKNIQVKDSDGTYNWNGQDFYANATGSETPPVILRGDRISINLGYYYNIGTQSEPNYITTLNEEFNGYITKINPKIPMEIECEDNMWLLKQAMCPNMVFPANTSTATYVNGKGATVNVKSFDGNSWCTQNIMVCLLQSAYVAEVNPANPFISNTLLPELSKINVINGAGLNENISTSVGNFRTQNETICQVLMRLQKDYKLECFFRRDLKPTTATYTNKGWSNLYVSGIVYYPIDYLSNTGKLISTQYDFQQNIINQNNLIYLRKDDVRLGIKAYSVGKYELTHTNSSGGTSTKSQRLEVAVGDTDGEIRTMFFYPKTNTSPDLDKANLLTLANQALLKLKFEGWHGNFNSFGLPYVQHGQAVTIKDVVIPERTGTYLIKGTKVNFGQGGFRREIELHIRIDAQTGFDIKELQNGL